MAGVTDLLGSDTLGDMQNKNVFLRGVTKKNNLAIHVP